MSKEKKQKEIYTSVFKTKLWKKLYFCCLGAATGSVLLLALLFFGSRSIIYHHMAEQDVQQTQKDQVMAELQAFVSQRGLSTINKKEILQWEKKKGVMGTKDTIRELETLQAKYNNSVISIYQRPQEIQPYEVRFKDAVVLCEPILDRMTERYTTVALVISVLISTLFFIFLLMQCMKKRLSYVVGLRDDLRLLEAGDLDREVTVSGNDELSQIGEGINNLRRNVLHKIQTERDAITANHELITAMSHDLRTPLTKQIGYLEILYRRKFTQEEELFDYIQKARSNAFIMKDTTDKLFRYFLAFGGQQQEAQQSEVDGKALLNSVLKEQIAYINSQGFVVSFSPIQESFRMLINPEEFARIFDNIFHNLRKYGDNTVPVNISYTLQPGELLLMVQNGVRQDTSKVESTKIGLKIVEKIMKSMGGSVEVMNDGQYFIIQLVFKVDD
ncbi:HAMP domain-containing histidine kinase [Kineothrix sp. MSJ-39]|uniref:sensor histidine kinase n=1 Tax=Kineothrix sp. MSJ-39 TaxID=2841533 RepID=UPI001C103B75|nr:HAMP domain-containing sensor histidine kinase [Kineothrix sp. MSJ-39]MBU5428996.1 HAMP domain-containing histidine kinase [Kineothrix sp. MSJ-39]